MGPESAPAKLISVDESRDRAPMHPSSSERKPIELFLAMCSGWSFINSLTELVGEMIGVKRYRGRSKEERAAHSQRVTMVSVNSKREMTKP